MYRIPLLAVGIAVFFGVGARAGAQESLEEARERRDAIEQAAAENAAELDVLGAEDVDLVDGIAQLDAWATIQEAGLTAVQQALRVAEDAETAARSSAQVLDDRLAELRQQVAAQSVETYMGGFGDALIFETTDLNTVPLLKFLLEEATGRNSDSAAQLRVVLQVRRDLLADAEAAAVRAADLSDQVAARLDTLSNTRADRRRLQGAITERIRALEVEAVGLAEDDRLVAEIIQGEEQRLAAEEAARRAEERRAAELRRQAEEQAARDAELARLAALATPTPAPTPTPVPTPATAATATPGPTATLPEPGTTPAPTEAGEPAATATPTPIPSATPTATPAPPVEGTPTFVWPTNGNVVSLFGNRVHPVYGTVRFHAGLDIDNSHGTPIGAAADGFIFYSGWFSGYGNTVIVDHGDGFTTLYAHMSAPNTTLGSLVTAGDIIGFVGTTGLSTGPHLHFEVRMNGVAVDPLAYLP